MKHVDPSRTIFALKVLLCITDLAWVTFLRPCGLPTHGIDVERCADGATILRSAQPLRAYDRAVGDWLVRWATQTPDRRFLAERAGDGWRVVTYAEALELPCAESANRC